MNKEYKPTGLVSMEEAIEALDDMDDYARMETGVNAYGPRGTLTAFIEQSHQNPNPISAMYHIVRGLVLELESIHKALGFEDAPINTKMMVESIDRLRQINIMTEEDELAIDTLSTI